MFELDETLIHNHASPESFRRGQDYFRQGAVVSMVRRGGVLHAKVAGSEPFPYGIRLSFDEAGVPEATCGCPYDWGGWCKHVVAAGLAALREPGRVKDLPALQESLSALDRDGLRDLLLKLTERDPSLADTIEDELSTTGDAEPPEPGTADVDLIRRRVRVAIGGADDAIPYDPFGNARADVGDVRRVLEGAWRSIEAGDGRGALPVLEAITEEGMEAWETFNFYEAEAGELLDLFEELGRAWTEALLSVELSPKEREDAYAKLDVWLGELADYEAGTAFEAALRVVEGEPGGEAADEEVYGRDDPLTTLTIARLNVLERQGRFDEYLSLADAAGETARRAVMLVRLGRTEEAVQYGLRRLAVPEEALAVAEALHERGEPEAALRIGERGLSLEGRKGRLAIRVRDLAESEGNPVLALEAGVSAFRAAPGLASYRRVRELAGEHWSEYREELLGSLRRSGPYYPAGPVEVFLYEDLIEDAIAAIERSPVEALVARVADAAVDSRPDWVIETSRRLAERIMEKGKSNHYDEAVRWLAKARDAHLAAGREEEWQAYLADLVDRHRRKYKLRPMLEDLAV